MASTAPSPVALTVAGSDSGGGAGIQGDIKTFERWGVFGTSVVTAVTAQNTLGVTCWEPVSPRLVRAQLDAVFSDLRPAALKTGMLGTPEVASTVAEALADYRPPWLVVDPVMVATSGDALILDSAVEVLRRSVLPRAALVTPNLDEATALVGYVVAGEDGMRAAAREIVERFGARAALVKGGHDSGDEICDVLYDGDWTVLRHVRVPSNATHGTGCALSAAITAQLALGRALPESVRAAVHWVECAITTAPEGLGGGRGPLNHRA